VIGGVVLVMLLFVGGLFGVIWYVQSPSAGSSKSGQAPVATTDPRDSRALAADLTGNHSTAKAAMEALVALGPPAEPEVRKYLNHDDFNARHRSAQVIEKIGTTASMTELRRVIKAGRSVNGACEQALAAIRRREQKAGRLPAPKPPPTPSEDAKRAAADLPGGHSAAAAAMQKLMAMGPAAEGAVIPYLEHDNFDARERAAQVLETIGTSTSIDPLQRGIDARRLVFGYAQKAIAAIEERDMRQRADTPEK